MMKGNLNKEQAINLVGEEAIDAVESAICEPSGRVGYNGACQGDSLTEWCASVSCNDPDGDDVWLTAYYYTTNEQDEMIAETGDGGSIDWEIKGYEVF